MTVYSTLLYVNLSPVGIVSVSPIGRSVFLNISLNSEPVIPDVLSLIAIIYDLLTTAPESGFGTTQSAPSVVGSGFGDVVGLSSGDVVRSVTGGFVAGSVVGSVTGGFVVGSVTGGTGLSPVDEDKTYPQRMHVFLVIDALYGDAGISSVTKSCSEHFESETNVISFLTA